MILLSTLTAIAARLERHAPSIYLPVYLSVKHVTFRTITQKILKPGSPILLHINDPEAPLSEYDCGSKRPKVKVAGLETVWKWVTLSRSGSASIISDDTDGDPSM